MLQGEIQEMVLCEIRRALQNDTAFDFKRDGKYLRKGKCPQCGEKECYVSLDQPLRVQCGRLNKCDWSETTRKLYPQIFDNLASRFKKAGESIADVYMAYNRGFNLEKIKGMYQLGSRKLPTGRYCDTVRVQLWDGHYWERLIDADAVKDNHDRKVMFSYGSADSIRGNAWIPPGMTIEKGDQIIITEGIFKSMAWLHVKDSDGNFYKSISPMSASNLPTNVIEQHKGKDILWVLALDNDNAGHRSSEKFSDFMRGIHEKFLIAFPEKEGEDWDDLFRKGRLTNRMYQESLWRGHVDMAKSAFEKAAWIYAKKRQSIFHLDFNNELYRCEINALQEDPFFCGINGRFDYDADLSPFREIIKDLVKISNTNPQFLYFERDAMTGDLEYYFRIPIGERNNSMSVVGSLVSTPETFSKALLDNTPGGSFDGNKLDMRMLREKWFSGVQNYVRSLPFSGYDKISECYAFQDWGYYQGKLMIPNDDGYFVAGENHLKVKKPKNQDKTHSNYFHQPGKFDPEWISDYRWAFDWNGLVTLGWWLGTLFSEQIRQKYGYWPVMEVTGEQGTGKTQMIEFLWRCCGRNEYEGFDPSKSTMVGRGRTFQQVSNLPVVLLEGDRESGKAWDYNEIKMLYNGRYGRAIGVKTSGNETIEGVFRGGVLIAQNATVATDADAVLARIVQVHCTKEHFTPEGEQKALRLNRMPVQALSGFIGAALGREKELIAEFEKQFDQIDAQYLSYNSVQNRICHNHAMVAAWIRTLPIMFGKYILPEWIQYLDGYLWRRAVDRQARCASDHPLLCAFWDQYEYLQGIPGEHGAPQNILNHSKNDEYIAINLQHFQSIAMQWRLETLSTNELKRLLPSCKLHKFVDCKVVRSALRNNSTIRCYVFNNEKYK